MSNKKLFKKLYFEKINKENNYKAILNSIERNNMKKIKWKWALIPACLIVIFVGITLFNINNNDIKEIKYNNNIIINSFEKVPDSIADIDGKFEDKNIEELISKFNFIKNLNIEYESTRFGSMYVRNDLNDLNYNKLYGYNLIYVLDEKNSKTIDIFFSETEKERLRCLIHNIDLNELKSSNINNTTIKIIQMGNYYMGIFKYNDLYFDIETYNLTEKEFVELLESITK